MDAVQVPATPNPASAAMATTATTASAANTVFPISARPEVRGTAEPHGGAYPP